jgi:hypothetical protein
MFNQPNIGLTCLKVQVMGVSRMSGFRLVLGVFVRVSAEGEEVALPADFDAARKGQRFATFGLLRQPQHGVNVDRAKLAGVRFHLFDQESNHALAHGLRGAPRPETRGLIRLAGWNRRSHEITEGNAPLAFVLLRGKKKAQLSGAVEPSVLFAGKIGKLREMLDNGGLESLFEKRQEFRADAGTQAAGIAVGRVFAPSLAAKAEVRAQLVAAEFEQGAEDHPGFGVNAGEPGKAGAPKNVGEDGFGLVVGSVGDGDVVETSGAGEAFEEGVAGAAGSVFKIGVLAPGLAFDVFVRDEKRKIMAGGKRGHKSFVGVGGAAAQFVIEVGDGKDDAERFTEFEEKKKQSHGIGPA